MGNKTRQDISFFNKKNWKNRGKTLKNRRKKTENYKKYRNEILTRFLGNAENINIFNKISGNAENGNENKNNVVSMSRNNDSRAKTRYRCRPTLSGYPEPWSSNSGKQ